MKFTTPVPVKPRQPGIDYNSRVFLLGSCFVENIGEKLEYYKFQHYKNPFGILYHPKGIAQFIEKVEQEYTYSSKDVFFHQERWHCFDAHSRLSNPVQETLLEELNTNLRLSKSYLQETSHIIITLGTSWIYKYLSDEKYVANCHKVPQSNFEKELTGVEEIVDQLNVTITALRNLNPAAEIIFTVSPVRHIKDGMVENQQSKAHLIAAIHKAIALQPNNSSYFPAFEIMVDELRDYRFYAEDMLHPNSIAVTYIWEKFLKTWLHPDASPILNQIEHIQKALSHRPFNEKSNAHQQFLAGLRERITNLKSQFSHIEFE